MDFGSFLSSAGRIGEGIERYQTESEQRRLMQQQAALAREQLARAELNRQKEAERIAGITFDAPPRVGLPLSTSVSEPEADLSALSAAGLAAPVPTAGLAAPGAPAAPGGRTAAPGGRTAGLAAPSDNTPLTPRPIGQSTGSGFGGARTSGRRQAWTGWRTNMASPVLIGTADFRNGDNALVFRRVDPNAPQSEQNRVAQANDRTLTRLLNEAADRSLRYRGRVPEDVDEVARWYRSAEARELFKRDPNALIFVASFTPITPYSETRVHGGDRTFTERQAGVTRGTRTAPAGRSTPSVVFRGVTVPGFSSADPVRLNTFGGQGFRRVDPQATNFERGRVERYNTAEFDRQLRGLFLATNVPLGAARGYFASAEERQRIEASNAAAQWYQSDNAREYFRRNPEMLAVASTDPVGFKDAVYRASDIRASNARADAATARRAEQERTDRPTSTPLAPAAPAAPSTGVIATPAGSTRRAQNFDRQGPQWDGVIQQAATQFGVDPVILKRLLASESNFLTTNNSGQVNRQSGALGPAQIMPDHIQRGIVTEEQARDPTIAIFFMAAHLAQNLRNEGGDYTMALLRYKGALSPRGIASMTPVVRDITSGFQWDEQQVLAAVGPQLARTRDPATNASIALRTIASGGTINAGRVTGVQARGGGQAAGGQAFGGGGFQVSGGQNTPVPVRMDPSSFYLADPDATTLDIDAALRQRAELVEMATTYQQTGSVAEFRAVQQQIRAVDNSLYFLQGMQGIQELELANDPRRLSAVWSQFAGVPIQLQPQTDGTYNILVNGQITQRGVSRSAIIASARSSFDREFAQAQAAAAAQQTALYLASQLRMSENMAEITAKAFADIQLKLLEGDQATAIELVRQMDPNGRITALPGDTGRAVLQVQGQTFIIDQGGVQVQGAPEGVTSAPSAQPLAGLPQRTVAVGTGG